MKIVPFTAQVYEEQLPDDSPAMKECADHAKNTLDRIETMRLKGWKNGYNLKLRANATEDLFVQPDLPKRHGIPSLKLSELKRMNEALKDGI